MTSRFLFLLSAFSQTCLAATFPLAAREPSTDITVGWVSDPSGRGTLTILLSCVLTLGLCVWSALHLNIPPAKDGFVRFWLRSIKWTLVGVLGPELVVFEALRQYKSAKNLHRQVLDVGGISNIGRSTSGEKKATSEDIEVNGSGSSDDDDESAWSIVHGFYAGMGGFVFDLDPVSAAIFSSSTTTSSRRRFTLTPRGVALLARCGILPEIRESEIMDKSDADGIAKALACLQAAWMLIQVVARVAEGMAVTMLEVNTIGHVICAFAIYMLWWSKPRLISEPTPVKGDWVLPVCAYMWLSSEMSDRRIRLNLPVMGPPVTPELSELAFHPWESTMSAPSEPAADSGGLVEMRGLRQDGTHANSPDWPLRDPECPEAPKNALQCASKPKYGFLGPGQRHPSYQTDAGDTKTTRVGSWLPDEEQPEIQRWVLALDAMQRFPAIAERMTDKPLVEELICDRMINWSSKGLLTASGGLLVGMGLWFASMSFGAVHIAAWNGYFPSPAERWLWRWSGLYIAASGLLWVCINLLAAVSMTIDAYWNGLLDWNASRINYIVIGSLCTVCGLAYGFARIYLVLEAFISLRQLPSSAFDTPDWSQLIPHL